MVSVRLATVLDITQKIYCVHLHFKSKVVNADSASNQLVRLHATSPVPTEH